MSHISVLNLDSSRFIAALKGLEEGWAFDYHDVGFWLGDGFLNVICNSSYHFNQMTQTGVLRDFGEGKDLLEQLIEYSPEFAAISQKYPIRYILAVGVGKMSGGWAAKMIDGKFAWSIPHPPFVW